MQVIKKSGKRGEWPGFVAGLSVFFGLCAPLQVVSAASPGTLGLGVIFGEPTGFTGKHWVGGDRAWDGGLAYSFNSHFLIFADHLWHFPRAFSGHRGGPFLQQLTPYLGVGGVFMTGGSSKKYESSVALGVRIPLGIEWKPANPPLGVYVEVAPGVGIVPGAFGFVQGGLGVRYYF